MRGVVIVGSSGVVPPSNPKSPPNNRKQKPSRRRPHSWNSHTTTPTRRAPTSTSTSSPGLNNFHQTTRRQSELASKLAHDGRLDEFLMVAETALVSNSSDPSPFVSALNLNLVSAGVAALISQGGTSLDSVLQFFTRIHNLGILPSHLFDDSVHKLLALECRRLFRLHSLKELLTFMETLAGFQFPVKEFIKPSEIIKLCVQKSDPDAAVRYACLLPHSPLLFSSIILEFGKKGDLMSAATAYEASKCTSGGINMYVCRTMIDVCGVCGDFLKSRYIYEGLLAAKITPNTYFFNSLMNVNAHDLSYALHIYEHMKTLGVSPDLASYNILLKACVRAGRVDLGQDIYEEVRHIAFKGKLKLDVITYSTIIKGFADAKMWKMALKVKEDMISAGVSPNVFTWSSLISACANAGRVEQAIQVFDEMLLDGCEPNSQCYNSLLNACVEACQYDKAFRLFQAWRESGFQTSGQARKYDISSQLHISANNSTESEVSGLQSVSSNTYKLSSNAAPFIPTISTFNILMKACGTDYYRAQALMGEIKRAGLCPNHISWSIFLDICGNTGNVGASVQVLKTMRDNGIKPDVIAYTTAIKACIRNRSLKLAFSLFEEMKRYRVKPNLVTYNTLLRARRKYGSVQEVQQCLSIYQDMRKAGYSPNDYFLKELIEEWCEGAIANKHGDKGIVQRSYMHNKTDREAPQSMLLEKVASYLQRDISQSLVVDIRGLTKVEARIVVLAVLRVIKENYKKGDTLEDDIVIIIGAGNHTLEVQDTVVKLLCDELGLSLVMEGPKTSVIGDLGNRLDKDLTHKSLGENEFPTDSESLTRRPAVLRRVKVTKKSLYHWLQKGVGISRDVRTMF